MIIFFITNVKATREDIFKLSGSGDECCFSQEGEMPGYYRYNRRYGARVGPTTRRFPGYYRRPTTTYLSPTFRRRIGGRYGVTTTKRILNVINQYAEKKYYDIINTSAGPLAWSDGGNIFDITSIPQGTTDITRIGDKIMLNSIEIRYMLQSTFSANPTIYDQFYRLILFKWYDDSGPTTEDILETSATAIGIISVYDHDRKPKRKILLDEMVSATITKEFTTFRNTAIHKNFFVDLKKRSRRIREVAFEASTVNGIGKIYMLIISNIPLASIPGNGMTWRIYTRLNYTDV